MSIGRPSRLIPVLAVVRVITTRNGPQENPQEPICPALPVMAAGWARIMAGAGRSACCGRDPARAPDVLPACDQLWGRELGGRRTCLMSAGRPSRLIPLLAAKVFTTRADPQDSPQECARRALLVMAPGPGASGDSRSALAAAGRSRAGVTVPARRQLIPGWFSSWPTWVPTSPSTAAAGAVTSATLTLITSRRGHE
jgi:hypothetical protein